MGLSSLLPRLFGILCQPARSTLKMDGLPLHSFSGRRHGSTVYHAGDGFYYHLNNRREGCRFAYLRCCRYDRAVRPCSGTAKALLAHRIIIPLAPHNHRANPWYQGTEMLRAAVARRVQQGDQAPTHEILHEEGLIYPIEVRARVPVAKIESRLNQIRAQLQPPVPATLGILGFHLLQEQYSQLTECLDQPENLFAGVCGSMAEGTLSLVFICDRMKQFMESRSLVFADGTERKLFQKPKASQIFSVVGIWRFNVIPMLRAIMLKRTQQAYCVLFEFIKILMPNFQPSNIMCDFEDAQQNAWRVAFPLANVDGCLWHFDVAVLRHATKKLGLYHLIANEDEVSSIIRSVLALPLLPPDDIETGLIDLGQEALEKGWMPHLRQFFQYMEREWIPKARVLSVCGSVHRTNNASESGNKAYNKEIKVCRPGCFPVIKAFVKLNDRALVDLRTLALGLSARRPRKLAALRNDRRIKNLTQDLSHGDITRLQFLHRASRRMQGVFNKFFH